MLFSFVIELYSVFAKPDEWKSWQFRKKLLLGELPQLPLVEILRSMSLKDQIKLALSSKKYEEICKMAMVKVKWFGFHARGDMTNLNVGPATKMNCGKEQFIDNLDNITYEELKKWCNLENSSTPLHNLLSVYERVNAIFRTNVHHLLIYKEDLKTITLKDVLVIPLFKNCESIALVRGEIDSDELCHVLDTAKHLKYFRLLEAKVPSDFQHERAFSIERIEYDDANWVRLENLLTMRNSTYVKLGTTSLAYSDFNTLLKFWVNSEVDMFIDLLIEVTEGIDSTVLFEGLLRLDSTRYTIPAYFIISKRAMVNRKRPFLLVDYYKGDLRFLSYSLTFTEIRELKRDKLEEKKFQPEFEALRVLEQREELGKKMEEVEGLDEDDTKMMEELNTKLNVLLAEGKFTIGE